MSEVKITDLVSQETIDKVKELSAEMQSLLTSYTDTAKELAKGININVRGLDDIDKLEKLLVEKSKEAAVTNEKLNSVLAQQSQVVSNTTNTIARQLMEQERVNKAQREAYTDTESFKRLLEQVNGSYENRIKRLVETNQAIAANKKQQDDLKKSLDMGKLSQEQYNEALAKLVMKERELKQSKADLTSHLKNEEREMQSVEGSYKNLSQRLELMKKAYKDLTEEERSSPLGKEMETAIQNLDAHLKDVAADMGEFQRNVGNYAIAGQNGVVSTESLVAAMNQEAITMQDIADQTRILEEGKRMLDTTDEHYAETLAAINAQIDENKAKLTDVSDIMEKDATSAAEAEGQNKRLMEAMKHIDVTAEGAQARIDELNSRIERNNAVIDQATPSTEKLAKEEKELAEAAKAAEKELAKEQKTNESLAGQMLSLIGVNQKFGSSLTGLESGGNVIAGLNTKVKAFGQTLLGLLANPWVLAFLGIAGVAAGFKWWYDYNKGLIEASRLTQNFTGLTGNAADKITAHTQAIAKNLGKGYDETISAANTLVQQFGLTWKEALDKISDGIEAGANTNGRFVENINQFAPALRDAGVSVDEFVSILAETRNGIFDEKGVQDIIKGGTRLRAMTKQVADSLDACGISSKQLQKDLADGNITMLEAVQQVSAKLKELPENSQEAGQVIKNVFGRTAAEGGTLLIQSLADVNTNLDEAKARMGDLGRLNREQLEAQKELNEALSAVFKASGTSFEEMTIQAKTYIIQGLTKIIKGCVDIVNWFIRMYNRSIVVRGAINSIVNSFKTMWEIAKFILNHIVDSFKAMGTVIEGVVTMKWDKVMQGWKEGLNALKGNVSTMAKNIASNTAQAFSNTIKDELHEVSINLDDDTSGGGNKPNGRGAGSSSSGSSDKDSQARAKAAKQAQKDAERRAKEELKRLQELEDSKIAMMADGHDKDLALIRQKFKKKMDEIKGNGETENALRLQLAEQCQREIEVCELSYQQELAKTNLANALAAAKEGSKEELDLKLAQLEAARQAEIKAAEQTGADVNLINAKFNKERDKLYADYADSRAAKIQEEYATEEVTRNQAYSNEVNALKKRYAEEFLLAKGNAKKQEDLKYNLEKELYELEVKYTREAYEANIKMIEEILKLENMSAEDRLKWENELAKAKIALLNMEADAAQKASEDQIDADDKLWEKRKENLETWLGVASDTIGNITELVSALYDGQIAKIEKEQEANTAAGEEEQTRIAELVEKKVITEEEGEARKRAAEAQTAKKNEELEKKKAQLQRKQAIWEKTNSLAQAGIATALAITQALPNLVLAAIAGTMGAVQMATILATPIPQYAKGTDFHIGGPAIVGDGGRRELVMFNGAAWLTPDTPTLVDLPKGASVIPDIMDDNPAGLMPFTPITPERVKPFHDIPIRRSIAELAYLIRVLTKTQYKIANANKYELFKQRI